MIPAIGYFDNDESHFTSRHYWEVGATDATLDFPWTSDGAPHWLRLNARDAEGRLVLIGNPIYVNFAGRGEPAR